MFGRPVGSGFSAAAGFDLSGSRQVHCAVANSKNVDDACRFIDGVNGDGVNGDGVNGTVDVRFIPVQEVIEGNLGPLRFRSEGTAAGHSGQRTDGQFEAVEPFGGGN